MLYAKIIPINVFEKYPIKIRNLPLHNFALKEVEEQAASDAEAEVDVPKVAGVGVHLEA